MCRYSPMGNTNISCWLSMHARLAEIIACWCLNVRLQWNKYIHVHTCTSTVIEAACVQMSTCTHVRTCLQILQTVSCLVSPTRWHSSPKDNRREAPYKSKDNNNNSYSTRQKPVRICAQSRVAAVHINSRITLRTPTHVDRTVLAQPSVHR